MKKCWLVFAVCLLAAGAAFSPRLYAQTAAEIEGLLSVGAVTYEQAAWFVLRAADVNAASPGGAFSHASERGWLPAGALAADAAALEGISLLVMRSFGLDGGIFYTRSLNAHFAYRELVYRGVIQGRADPQMTVSGDALLYIVNSVLSIVEGR